MRPLRGHRRPCRRALPVRRRRGARTVDRRLRAQRRRSGDPGHDRGRRPPAPGSAGQPRLRRRGVALRGGSAGVPGPYPPCCLARPRPGRLRPASAVGRPRPHRPCAPRPVHRPHGGPPPRHDRAPAPRDARHRRPHRTGAPRLGGPHGRPGPGPAGDTASSGGGCRGPGRPGGAHLPGCLPALRPAGADRRPYRVHLHPGALRRLAGRPARRSDGRRAARRAHTEQAHGEHLSRRCRRPGRAHRLQRRDHRAAGLRGRVRRRAGPAARHRRDPRTRRRRRRNRGRAVQGLRRCPSALLRRRRGASGRGHLRCRRHGRHRPVARHPRAQSPCAEGIQAARFPHRRIENLRRRRAGLP